MKNVILLALLFTTAFQTLITQEQDDFELITSGKWHIEYVEMSGQKIPMPIEMQNTNWVVFHADGKQEGMEEGRKYVGKWEYDASKKVIRTDDLDGKVEQKLISVDQNSLVVSVKEQGVDLIMGMKKMLP